ncbi:hypothetical protein D9756_010336 [Leucocoprinus leucothites]|uniref:G domain-containing protein n=1 Tax=Leucocoprinus leucothites TaxID=201217 RepID=A0A8H5CTP7_9AGAR|nr:hypothetical protein D9756_010336 [Leucoagaricus leucothites]
MPTQPSGSSLGPLRLSRGFKVEENINYPETFEVVRSRHLKESDTVIILMGFEGTGKTSLISNVLGRDVGIGHTLIRETTEVRGYRFRLPGLEEDVVLVDTPGFEYYSDDYKILETIANWLEQIHARVDTKMPAPSGSSPGPLQPSRVLNVEENVTYPETFEVVHSRHLKESDTVIILIGLVGTGKTAFISEVLGQDVGIGSRLARETAEVRGYRFRLPRMDEDLVLVDTPGFEDHSDDYEILETIANWLEQMYLRKVRFSGILLLHRITDNLARPVVWKHLQSFENIYETQLFSRVLFVTTMWNDRTDKVFVQRERELVSIFWGLMGLVGTGKTSLISKVLGRDVGIGHTFIRETTEVKGYGTRLPGVEGDVVLVDTPGFEYDSDDYKILETIANWLEQMGLRKVRFSGILLLHRITDNSARFAVWKYLRSFEKIYESQLFSRVLFVTTMWDGPPYEETFVQRERQLAREYWRDMIDQGARIIRLQKNTHAAALRVIKFLQENRGEPQLEFTPGRVPELISELRGEKKNSEVEIA